MRNKILGFVALGSLATVLLTGCGAGTKTLSCSIEAEGTTMTTKYVFDSKGETLKEMEVSGKVEIPSTATDAQIKSAEESVQASCAALTDGISKADCKVKTSKDAITMSAKIKISDLPDSEKEQIVSGASSANYDTLKSSMELIGMTCK